MTQPAIDSPRPRILHCVSHLALGGAERVALTVIRELKHDFDFSVLAIRGVEHGAVGLELRNQLAESNVPLALGSRISMRHGGILTGAYALARAIDRFSPAVIHLHTEIPEASYSALVALVPSLRGISLIRTIHNSTIWQFAPRLGRFCDRLMSHGYVAGVSRDATTAFNQLRAASHASAPPAAAITILNGIDVIGNAPAYSRPNDVIRVVYGGRLEWEKGTDLLPQIIAATRLPANTRAHLTIHGSGRHESLLRTLASQPPAGWTIEVQRQVPHFAARLREFDIALLPSRYEGLALTALEALRARIQVVATDAPGLHEAVPPNHPWLARSGDPASFSAALTNACAHRERWVDVASAGHAFSLTEFTPHKMAAGYRSLYQRVLGHNSAARRGLPVI